MEELLAAIREAANTIATPNWAAALSGIASFIAILVAIAVAVKQNKIAKEQSSIMQKQTEIAQEQAKTVQGQTEIAKKQTEISEQQNKIALFKERYAVYCEFRKIISFSEQLKYIEMDFNVTEEAYPVIVSQVLSSMDYNFGTILSTEEYVAQKVFRGILTQIQLSKYIVKEAIFLFSDIEEKEIDDLINKWTFFISALFVNRPLLGVDLRDNFITPCEQFSNKHMKKMEIILNLK